MVPREGVRVATGDGKGQLLVVSSKDTKHQREKNKIRERKTIMEKCERGYQSKQVIR